MAQIILTQPQNTSSGIPGTIITGIVIPFAPGSNIVNVDGVPIGSNASIKWLYTLMSTAQDKVLSAEVVVVYRITGGSISFNRYSIVGDKNELSHSIDVKVDTGNVVLEITNLTNPLASPTDFTATIVRIQTLS
ncbi:MAG: hypothetical protein KAS32_25510 [Candidatus Peribacteraceae bacterium]|nr:hypothetical protein [Candidatus Peribacteraceae bacterium]